MKNYYEIIGVDKNEVKNKIRKKIVAMRRQTDDEDKRQELNEALEIFRDVEKRYEYDARLEFFHRKKLLGDEFRKMQKDERISEVFEDILASYLERCDYSEELQQKVMKEIISGNRDILKQIEIIKGEYGVFFEEREELIRKIEEELSIE